MYTCVCPLKEREREEGKLTVCACVCVSVCKGDTGDKATQRDQNTLSHITVDPTHRHHRPEMHVLLLV